MSYEAGSMWACIVIGVGVGLSVGWMAGLVGGMAVWIAAIHVRE